MDLICTLELRHAYRDWRSIVFMRTQLHWTKGLSILIQSLLNLSIAGPSEVGERVLVSLRFLDTQVAAFSTWGPPEEIPIPCHTKPPSHSRLYHRDVWVLPTVPLEGYIHVYIERVVNVVATGKIFFRVEEPMVWLYNTVLWVGTRWEREWGREYLSPHSSADSFRQSAHFLPSSSFSGSRDFCLVGGNSTCCQEQVPKNAFLGLPLPLALWTGWHLG